MDSILGMIASTDSAFAEMSEALTVEFDEALAIRRGYIRRQHRVIRRRPHHKALGLHTRSEHKSHGYGSFCRTHPNHRTC